MTALMLAVGLCLAFAEHRTSLSTLELHVLRPDLEMACRAEPWETIAQLRRTS